MIRLSPSGFYYASNAIIAGSVSIGRDSNIWFGAILRGDVAPIRIGQRVNVQDQVVIHCDSGEESVIEDEVSIGHGAIIHGVRIGSGTLIAMGAKVLGHAIIGRNCIIAAGAVVPEGMQVPDHSVVMGVPGKIRRQRTTQEREYIAWIAEHYVSLSQRWLRGEFPQIT